MRPCRRKKWKRKRRRRKKKRERAIRYWLQERLQQGDREFEACLGIAMRLHSRK